jgi:hypothetical protein
MVLSTFADLILKAVSFVTGERARLRSAKRDQVDRIADYLQNISDGLKRAAEKFASGDGAPWRETREMAYHLDHLLLVLADAFKDDAFAVELRRELGDAVSSDYRLLDGSRNRTAVDAITLRPPGLRHYEEVNPVSEYSSKQLEQVLADEVRKLEEASGLFGAAAQELRAMVV